MFTWISHTQDQSISYCLPSLVLKDQMKNLEPEREKQMNPVRAREECTVISLKKERRRKTCRSQVLVGCCFYIGADEAPCVRDRLSLWRQEMGQDCDLDVWPSFDEVFKVSLRPDFSFSNVIFLQSNYIMNNLWLAHKPSSHIWTLSVSAFICL